MIKIRPLLICLSLCLLMCMLVTPIVVAQSPPDTKSDTSTETKIDSTKLTPAKWDPEGRGSGTMRGILDPGYGNYSDPPVWLNSGQTMTVVGAWGPIYSTFQVGVKDPYGGYHYSTGSGGELTYYYTAPVGGYYSAYMGNLGPYTASYACKFTW